MYDVLIIKYFFVDVIIGEVYLCYYVYVYEGNFFYKGKLVVENYQKV